MKMFEENKDREYLAEEIKQLNQKSKETEIEQSTKKSTEIDQEIQQEIEEDKNIDYKKLWIYCRKCYTFYFKEFLLEENRTVCTTCGATLKMTSSEQESGEESGEEIEQDRSIEVYNKYKHLWIHCENCDTLHFREFFVKEDKSVCTTCGATLQMTSSERIELLIDDGTWCPMDIDFYTLDLLDKKHTTSLFDVTMVRRVSILLYKVIFHKYFNKEFFIYNEFFSNYTKTIKTLLSYNNTVVDILRVVLDINLIKYLNSDSKKNINKLQDIIGTTLKTVKLLLFEICNKISFEFYFFPFSKKVETQVYLSFLDAIEKQFSTSLQDRGKKLLQKYICEKIQSEKKTLDILYELRKKLADLGDELQVQEKLVKVVAVNLFKIGFFFPEEKIEQIFNYYPGYCVNYPQPNYLFWLREQMAICLMEKYLVPDQFKYWFQNRHGFPKKEEHRFSYDVMVEHMRKQETHEFYKNMDDDPLYSSDSEELFHEIDKLYLHHKENDFVFEEFMSLLLEVGVSKLDETIRSNKSEVMEYTILEAENDNLAFESFHTYKKPMVKRIEYEIFNELFKYYENNLSESEDTEKIYLYLLEIVKEFSALAIDRVKKLSKKEELSIKKREDIEEESYEDYNTSYQEETGLPDAIQTGIGRVNGINVALGVMDFQFMGGSMGSVVGEKITRLIQHATDNYLPLIIVCASGGARMQEGSFSLMQMNKIAAALHTHQKEKKLLYISILTSPTTGGVTASFGMLANVTIVEPNAYIAFAGKRVIEETLNQIVEEDSQISDSLFDFGMFDIMVPRAILKDVLSEIMKIYILK
uniref:Acetyl-coenzyme A carboxylase carboxyl transferase subunit beta, chloroplastic n=1 Tax=Torreya californica TaxID=89482 RepID=A0A650FI26_TORCL|nr:acetyl-CoA carboxylase subunit beta [Torreya californica]